MIKVKDKCNFRAIKAFRWILSQNVRSESWYNVYHHRSHQYKLMNHFASVKSASLCFLLLLKVAYTKGNFWRHHIHSMQYPLLFVA